MQEKKQGRKTHLPQLVQLPIQLNQRPKKKNRKFKLAFIRMKKKN
jgi:hypothetical protein